VRRGGSSMQIPVTMKEFPQTMMAENYPFQLSAAPNDNGDPGLRLAPLDTATRAQLTLPASVSGALVTSVPPGSAADRAGLQVNDVVVQVDGNAVTDPEGVQKLVQQVRKAGQAQAALLVADKSGQHWVALSTGAASSN
jgi:S1-C subfamily serine protease